MLNRATKDDIKALRIPQDDAWKFVRLDHGKANMAPPKKAEWYQLESERLEVVVGRTGEHTTQSVQAIDRWYPQELNDTLSSLEVAAIALLMEAGPAGPIWRENVQTNARWAGRAIEAVRVVASEAPLSLDRSNQALTAILLSLVSQGVLAKQAVAAGKGKTVPFIATRSDWKGLEKEADPEGAQALADKATKWLASGPQLAA